MPIDDMNPHLQAGPTDFAFTAGYPTAPLSSPYIAPVEPVAYADWSEEGAYAQLTSMTEAFNELLQYLKDSGRIQNYPTE